jgi:hypothetical protein
MARTPAEIEAVMAAANAAAGPGQATTVAGAIFDARLEGIFEALDWVLGCDVERIRVLINNHKED